MVCGAMQGFRARICRDCFKDPFFFSDSCRSKTRPVASDLTNILSLESFCKYSTNQCFIDSSTIDHSMCNPLAILPHAGVAKISQNSWRNLSLEEALVSLERGFLPHPSIEDFTYIVSKCSKEGNNEHIRWLHVYLKDRGMEAHSLLGDYVVLMLVKLGSLDDAEEVFNRLVYHNEEALNALVIGHVNCENFAQALSLYLKLQNEGTAKLNERSYVALIKACTRLKDLQKGLQICAEVARRGLVDKNIYIGNSLVDMYAKFGLLAHAQQVFDMLSERNVVSWTTLISGYAEQEQGEEALEYFEQMQAERVPINVVTFVCCLKACRTIGDIEKGLELHGQIENRGLRESNLIVATSLVDVYAKCGLLSEAQHVFDRISDRNVFSWTALMVGYAEHGHGEKALQCFEDMQQEGVSPLEATYVCALKACGMVGAIHKGEEIHVTVERSGLLEENLFVGCAMVSMYAKCGLLSKAHEIFEKLPTQNVVSWNALIAGYAAQGHAEEALKCLENMQLGGVFPNHATYVSTLNACGTARDVDKGREVHQEIDRQGLIGDLGVANALVDMYAKCGELVMAREVFDKLCVRTQTSWNALLGGYAEHAHGEETLKCFERMRMEGVSVNHTTLVCALKACSTLRFTDKGLELHAEVERQGLVGNNDLIGNTLVDLYAKAGWLAKAREVFDNLVVRDIVTWSALMTGYAEHGHSEEVLKCFEQIQLDSIALNAITLVCILKACGSMKALTRGQEIHAEVERLGFLEQDVVLGPTLIEMYSRCGSLAKAWEVFERMPMRDAALWNAWISGCSAVGDDDEALQSIAHIRQEGFVMDAGTYICGLKACGSLQCVDKGKELHAEVEQNGLLGEDPLVGNMVVDMYAKCGVLDKAKDVFDKLPVQDIMSWMALITGYAEHGCAEEAVKCLERMSLMGLPRDAFVLACALKACGAIKAIGKGKEIHAEIEGLELLGRDIVVGNALIDMYAKCGLLASAHNVLNELPAKDVVSWTALMAGYAEHGHGNEALKCLEQMQDKGFSLNAATFFCSLKACGSMGAMYQGMEIHAEIERKGLVARDIAIGNALVDMYGSCGCLAKVLQVFDKLPIQTIVSWTTLMDCYAHCDKIDHVLATFRRMLDAGVKPNVVTAGVLLAAFGRRGLFDKSLTYFESMSKDHGIAPVLEQYTCLMNLASKVGQIDEALAMAKGIPAGSAFMCGIG